MPEPGTPESYREEESGKLSLSAKRQRIRELYEAGWHRRTLPFMPEVTDPRGGTMEKIVRARPGDIEVEETPETDRSIRTVKTGTGLVVVGESELMTKELTGCQAVFVRGKTKDGKPLTSLFHLTPTSKLSWGSFRHEDDDARWGHEYRERTSEKLARSLEAAGADQDSLAVYLLRTAGDPPKQRYWGYSEDRLREKSDDLRRELEKRGLQTREMAPLPLEVMTVHWSPEAPDEIFAVGEKRIPSPDGGVVEPEVEARGVEAMVIRLGGAQ